MGWTDVRKVADGKRGLGEKHLERLKRRTDYLSRERARVDGEITPPASGNRGAPSALTLEIAESVKHQRGGHMELNDQGEQIWITCK
jgi:hypothetical protein